MAAMTIRNLDDAAKERLRIRAAGHGRSMEAEARIIIEDAVADDREADGLLLAVLDRFGHLGGVELEPELPRRSTPPRAPDLTT